jgi:hypothetical protein
VISQFLLAAAVALSGQTTPVAGSISGVVVNASQELAPVGGAEVVLRVRLEGQLVIAAEGIADEQGRFVFDNIPADADYIYLPGANRDGIHYPASRVKLSAQKPHARVKLAIHDTVADPNPLVLRRHDITIHPETDALRVTEKLLIENPSLKTYVGHPAREGGRATTLRLSIPSDFRRTTFEKEFYGRQFTLIDGRLVTDIPWTPGQRELAFTYVLPNEDRDRVWQRPLDLPCDHLRIEVHTDTPGEISCNLSRASSQTKGVVTFESVGHTLPADQIVRLQLESMPISLATYGRWLALAVLVGLVVATSLIKTQQRRKTQSQLREREPSIAPKQAA